MSKEFLQAAEAYAKKSRRVALGITVHLERDYGSTGEVGVGRETPYGRFRPRWLLIEPCPAVLLTDVLFGNMSQFGGHGPVPAALYSTVLADKLFESPDSPAWDRFKFESEAPLDHHTIISVRMCGEPALGPVPKTVQCVFIGDEVAHGNWETETRGTLNAVAMTDSGPQVEVNIGTGPIRIPIKPSDIPLLVEKIGSRVRFKLQTED